MRFVFLLFTVLILFSCKEVLLVPYVVNIANSNEIEIQINPSKNIPFSAKVSFPIENETQLKIYLDNDFLLDTLVEEVQIFNFYLLKVLPNKSNNLKIEIKKKNETTFKAFEKQIVVNNVPDYFPTTEINKINNINDEFLNLLYQGIEIDIESLPYVFNGEGEVVWFFKDSLKCNQVSGFELLKNGNLFFSCDTIIYEMDWLGNYKDSINTKPYILHHDLIELSNGNYLFPASLRNSEKQFDRIVVCNPTTKQIVTEIDLNKILDYDRTVIVANPDDRFHVNSVWEDVTDGNIIMSIRNQGIVKIDLQGNIIWILAAHYGWNDEFKDKLLTPVNSKNQLYSKNTMLGFTSQPDFDYSWGQHAAMQNSKGNIEVFDNGFKRGFSFYGLPYSRAVEYKINEKDKTVQQIWQFGKELETNFYSIIVGDVDEVNANVNLVFSGINWSGTQKSILYEIDKTNNTLNTSINLIHKNALCSGENSFFKYDYIYRTEKVKVPKIIFD